MGCMNEEQAVFELLTSSNYKKWSSTALHIFNSTITMTNNNDQSNIMGVVLLSLPYFGVNSTDCSGEFPVVFEHFQNLEDLLNILKELSCGLFF